MSEINDCQNCNGRCCGSPEILALRERAGRLERAIRNARMEIVPVVDGYDLSHARMARIDAALTPPSGAGESFEEWHRRECPAMGLWANPPCGGTYHWFFVEGVRHPGERFIDRTCREVYAEEVAKVPGAPRGPLPGESEGA